MQTVLDVIAYLQGSSVIALVLRLLFAALFGSLIGIERGRHGRAAGLRTHALVCLGAALAAEVGIFVTETIAPAADPMRIGAQVISGIGFLGVGTILVKGRFQVTGLTTAAGLWATAAIGLAVGIGFLAGALAGVVLTLLTITILSYLEMRINRRHRRFGVYIEIDDAARVRDILNHLQEKYRTEDVQITPPRSALAGHVGIEASVHTYDGVHHTPDEMITEVERIEGVLFVLESI